MVEIIKSDDCLGTISKDLSEEDRLRILEVLKMANETTHDEGVLERARLARMEYTKGWHGV